MKTYLTLICLLFCMNYVFGAEPDNTVSQSLSDRILTLQRKLKDPSDEVKTTAFREILPTEADIKVLFPKDAEVVWKGVSAGNEKMLKDAGEVARQWTKDEVVEVQAIDLRQEKAASHQYDKVLAIVPQDIPVYRVVRKRADGGSSGSSTYLFVNKRWIMIRGLEMIPAHLGR